LPLDDVAALGGGFKGLGRSFTSRRGNGGDVMQNARRWLLSILAIALVGGLLAPVAVLAQDAPDLPERVDVNIDTGDDDAGGAWYLSPVWLAIGAIAVIVLVLVVVLAIRGGGGGATVVTR
jgi:hypothetical protein